MLKNNTANNTVDTTEKKSLEEREHLYKLNCCTAVPYESRYDVDRVLEDNKDLVNKTGADENNEKLFLETTEAEGTLAKADLDRQHKSHLLTNGKIALDDAVQREEIKSISKCIVGILETMKETEERL